MNGVFMSTKEQRIYQFCQDCLLGKLTIQEVTKELTMSNRLMNEYICVLKERYKNGNKKNLSG
jgi:hypothetical protein